MKYICTLVFLALSISVFSQAAPDRINYQGVARSANGSPFVNQNIGLRFRILQGSATGTAAFTETQNLTTNALGLFSTQIGSVVATAVSTINWASGPYFLEVSIDTAGGTHYIVFGTQQLVSVPYSLYADRAGSAPDPTLAVTNNVLSVGANTVTLPSTGGSNLTITGSGAVTTTSTGPNTVDVNSPSVTISPFTSPQGNGILDIFGAFPNYTLAVAPIISYTPTTGFLYLNSPIPGSYSYAYNITPSLSLTGNTLSVGPPTNSVLIPGNSTPITTLVASGAATVTSPAVNSFSVSVPIPSITAVGIATVSGSYPSFTITTPPTLSTQAPSSVTGTGAATVTSVGGNTFDVNVATPSITAGSGITVGGGYPNYTVSANIPTVTVVASATAGLAQVSGTSPNYTVTVNPQFSYSSNNGSLVVSNPGNASLSYSTDITPLLNYNGGTGVLSAGPASNSITIPVAITPSVTGKGVAAVNPASGNSFTVNVPGTSVISANNTATVTSSGTNTFDISVPAQLNLGSSGGSAISGTYPNLTVSSPAQLNLGSSGGSAISGTYPNLTVSSPAQLNLTATGATTVGGTYPNINIGTPDVTLTGGTTIFGVPVPAGLAQVMGSYPNYSILVTPNIVYSQATGSLTLSNYVGTSPAYSYAYDITPNLSVSNNVIQSGPPSNTVSLSLPAAQAFALSGSSAAVATSGTQIFSTSFNKQNASSEIDVFVYSQVSAVLSLGNVTFEVLVDGNASAVSVTHVLTSGSEYITLKSIFSGLSTGSHTVSIRAKASLLSVSISMDPNSYGGKMILKETY